VRKIISSFVFLLTATVLLAAPKLPQYKGPINDPAGVLSPGAIKSLEAKAIAYREKTGVEIGVLIVPTLDHRSIEDYAHDIFNAWGIGQKDKNNGVLFLAAIQERKARIEVGYGLEAKLTDLESGRLVNKYSPMARYFRKGNYAAGVNAVLDGIVQAIGGEYNPPQPKNKQVNNYLPFGQIIFFVIVIFFIKLSRRRRSSHKGFGGPFIGGFGGSSGGGGGFSFGGGSSGGGGASGGW